ncbi:MAG: hypothetical protein ACSHX5_04735 [Phycisphaerales bacterium]
MSTVITGLFTNSHDAAAAIRTIEHYGIPESRLSLVAGSDFNTSEFGIESHSKLPEGVAVGASSGGAIGALIGGLTAVGAVATGGAGVVVAGPIVAALAGAGAGAASGGLMGGLVGLAIPEHEVKHYEDAIEEGAVLVGVECEDSDDKDMAKKTFEHFDASKVSSA